MLQTDAWQPGPSTSPTATTTAAAHPAATAGPSTAGRQATSAPAAAAITSGPGASEAPSVSAQHSWLLSEDAEVLRVSDQPILTGGFVEHRPPTLPTDSSAQPLQVSGYVGCSWSFQAWWRLQTVFRGGIRAQKGYGSWSGLPYRQPTAQLSLCRSARICLRLRVLGCVGRVVASGSMDTYSPQHDSRLAGLSAVVQGLAVRQSLCTSVDVVHRLDALQNLCTSVDVVRQVCHVGCVEEGIWAACQAL